MAGMQVNSAAGAASRQSAAPQVKEDPSLTLQEKLKEAREQARATRDRFDAAKPRPRYGDAPMEAYSRLARARRPAEVSAAAGYARRQIARLKAAKQTDPDNAKRIQAAINQLQKAVQRAGKKTRELKREKIAQDRQKKLVQERRTREARRQRQELLRKQALRHIRESGYLREAEADNRMQSQIAAVDMELREQAQKMGVQPSPEAAARQYAAAEAPAASTGGEINTQA